MILWLRLRSHLQPAFSARASRSTARSHAARIPLHPVQTSFRSATRPGIKCCTHSIPHTSVINATTIPSRCDGEPMPAFACHRAGAAPRKQRGKMRRYLPRHRACTHLRSSSGRNWCGLLYRFGSIAIARPTASPMAKTAFQIRVFMQTGRRKIPLRKRPCLHALHGCGSFQITSAPAPCGIALHFIRLCHVEELIEAVQPRKIVALPPVEKSPLPEGTRRGTAAGRGTAAPATTA